MAGVHFQNFRADLSKKLHEPGPTTNVLAQIEAKTGVDRFYLVSGKLFLLSLR